jgi:DNA invertase Pin-like site-specific DNA recombinase
LVVFLEHLRETRVELFLHQQGFATTRSSGAMFGMLSVFAQFERSIIRERLMAGMARAKVKGTRSGKAIGRPAIALRTRDDPRRLQGGRPEPSDRRPQAQRRRRDGAAVLGRDRAGRL